MSVKAGVWIDHKQAILFLITDAGQEIKKISSDIKGPGRSKSKHTYTPDDFVAEDRQERKFDSHLKNFYDEVIANLQGSTALLILGPGEAKGEFHKHITAKKLRGLKVEVETADKMSERQLAAKVSEHFTKAPATKSTAPKKKARAMSGKRPKKAAK
jgi:hypothetical protein